MIYAVLSWVAAVVATAFAYLVLLAEAMHAAPHVSLFEALLAAVPCLAVTAALAVAARRSARDKHYVRAVIGHAAPAFPTAVMALVSLASMT